MRRPWLLLALAPVLFAGKCEPEDDTDDTEEQDPEVLDPEPAGAPTDPIDGRWSCLGDNEQPAPAGGSVELTGYVRTLADPTATAEPPAAQIEAFDGSGTSFGTAFANPANAGRVSITVPVPTTGFEGTIVVTEDGFLDYQLQVSRPVTNAAFNGWAWLATDADVTDHAGTLGVTVEAGKGILAGSVHDCDGFGTANVVVTVDADPAGIYYVEGFDPVSTRTYTTTSGRFVLPNVDAGPVTVKAYGRLEAGGPLVLLSKIDATSVADAMSTVALEPRVGLTE